jgi:hypothetical protein
LDRPAFEIDRASLLWWNRLFVNLLVYTNKPTQFGETMIKRLIILGVGATALLMTAAASAAPLSANVAAAPESNIQNVRMVCNEEGRCWRDRGERRVIVRDRDGYAPRDRYIEHRSYDRDYDERGGIGFSAPGVSVGVGRY